MDTAIKAQPPTNEHIMTNWGEVVYIKKMNAKTCTIHDGRRIKHEDLDWMEYRVCGEINMRDGSKKMSWMSIPGYYRGECKPGYEE